MTDESADLALLCFDGSDHAREALERAAGLLKQRLALVLHVRRPLQELAMPYGGIAFGRVSPDVEKSIAEEARRVAEHGARIAREAGFDAEPMDIEARGRVADTILDVARERNAAVVVSGSRGLGGVRSALLGSVSSTLLHEADRPLLIVQPRPK